MHWKVAHKHHPPLSTWADPHHCKPPSTLHLARYTQIRPMFCPQVNSIEVWAKLQRNGGGGDCTLIGH